MRRRYTRHKIIILLVGIVVIFQLIQPEKNQGTLVTTDDISHVYHLSESLHQTLINKCYDCHSNHTRYPWYAHVQPIGWWLAAHVHDGKEELNFSVFRQYSPSRAEHKLEELIEVVEHRSMPLKSYLILHPDAELTDQEASDIVAWVKTVSSH